MKRLPALLLLLALICSVLLAQIRTDSTVYFKIDALIDRGEFDKLPSLVNSDAPQKAVYWAYFSERIKTRAGDFIDKKPSETINMLDPALDLLGQNQRADSNATARLWVWKALAHRYLEQYSDALAAYNNALRIYELNRFNAPVFAYAYNNAAQIYIRRKDYSSAQKYLLAGLQSDSTGRYKLSFYSQLANNAYWQDSLDLAWQYFKTGSKLSGDASASAALQSVGADVLLKKNRFREAENLIRQALRYYNTYPDEGENRLRCYTALASVAEGQGHLSAAAAHYQRAEAEGFAWYNNGKGREMAKLYTEWGDFLRKQGRKGEALAFYQKAMIQAYPKFNDPDPAVNPPIGEAPLELWAMVAPARKAALLLSQKPSLEMRRSAADCFDLAFAAADRLRRTYGTDEAKLFLTQNNYNLRRESALNLWEWHRKTGDPKTLERLFILLENNRANTLRDALQQQRALALSGVPDSLLQLEEQFRLEIADLQKNIQDEKGKNQLATAALQKRELTRTQLLYDELFNQLKNDFRQYRDYLNAGQTASLKDIRAALPAHAALLSWFDAGDRYLCLALRKNGLSGYEVRRDAALNTSLLRFQALLADKTTQETNPAAFFADAYFLKQQLLPDSILAENAGLIIVPDGRLAYLPFEVLLSKPHQGTYGSAPYLLRKHGFQYAWSATLLTAKPSTKKAAKRMLQVAPFVDSSRDGLALLPNSLREKPEHSAADILQGKAASADGFLKNARNYQVLQLSTHAYAGLKKQPGIEFFDRTVTLPEIYAQRLRASLVALSACETGAGKFAEGEGVLSLARAFAYAGAQSLVASHWSVSERSTADLFAAFYQQLEQGRSKSEALRQAKLQLLAEAGPDARKAPFYWAAFTLSGADGPVDFSRSWPWWVWVLGLIVVAFGIWKWR